MIFRAYCQGNQTKVRPLSRRRHDGISVEMTLPRVQPIAPSWRKEPFNHRDWLFDCKYDGFRALCYIEHGRSRLISRIRPPPWHAGAGLCPVRYRLVEWYGSAIAAAPRAPPGPAGYSAKGIVDRFRGAIGRGQGLRAL